MLMHMHIFLGRDGDGGVAEGDEAEELGVAYDVVGVGLACVEVVVFEAEGVVVHRAGEHGQGSIAIDEEVGVNGGRAGGGPANDRIEIRLGGKDESLLRYRHQRRCGEGGSDGEI